MKNNVKKITLVLSLVCAFGVLTACHTIQGAGQDLQSTGKAITNAADSTMNSSKSSTQHSKQ